MPEQVYTVRYFFGPEKPRTLQGLRRFLGHVFITDPPLADMEITRIELKENGKTLQGAELGPCIEVTLKEPGAKEDKNAIEGPRRGAAAKKTH